jgi:hypothetical protein
LTAAIPPHAATPGTFLANHTGRRTSLAATLLADLEQIRELLNDQRAPALRFEFACGYGRIKTAGDGRLLIVIMQALIGIMRQFVHSIGSQEIADYVLPSRKRFMEYFEARKADAAVAEMERHLKRINRNYLVLLAERSKSNESVAGRR